MYIKTNHSRRMGTALYDATTRKGEEVTKSEQRTWEEEDPEEDIIAGEMERQLRK